MIILIGNYFIIFNYSHPCLYYCFIQSPIIYFKAISFEISMAYFTIFVLPSAGSENESNTL